MIPLLNVRWFYRDESQWLAMAERLKLTACPHCHVVGTLNKHGSLYGYDDQSPRRTTIRARRIYCSNRHLKTGCGRTISVWLAEKIRRLGLVSRTLMSFLKLTTHQGLASAIQEMTATCHLCGRSWQRIWNRFHLTQSSIRTTLLGRAPPPQTTINSIRHPSHAQVLAHLNVTFPNCSDPIANYQLVTKLFFL